MYKKLLLTAVFYLLCFALPAQQTMPDAGQQPTDSSLQSLIDSNARQIREFEALQDSMDKIEHLYKNNNENLKQLMDEISGREKKRKQQAWIRMGTGVLLLGVLVVGVLRKRNRTKTK